MSHSDIDRLIQMLAKLPGLGPRSARRAALSLIGNRDSVMRPLAAALQSAADNVKACSNCRNLDTTDPCAICSDPRRDASLVCVVEQVGDLWALERTASFRGHYHVLGGVLSPLDGIGPDDLSIDGLIGRAKGDAVKEIIMATSATVDGRTTAHYISDRLQETSVKLSVLAHGIPVGGELDYLDDGTIAAALRDRRSVQE
ncbi:MAG: recombination mediator RecR [Rhodospirillales bacterium]|jgi:recombination protein RecR|nr:recombination protein RecR [Rhodospirillaceae bacterium]MDP6428383.1 recombination mediator RecR [Rhodospirillales bacterium]MDP6642863.1 recombination mediator RecR [Rhodospirillales bacterium]MDP6842984.1 recombination mediator RecR [Rhodospirillales bacterium]|tara:strand:- start:253 stop:852 length:600 start_codon:yes stop_codon:yes gene_type:complete